MNFVCLTFQPRPSHRLAIVTTAENHFLAANDNHDIADRRILITPDRNFRLSAFARHRNTLLCRESGSLFHCPQAIRFNHERPPWFPALESRIKVQEGAGAE
jgi:hypothetical protein